MNLKDVMQTAYATAKKTGWYDKHTGHVPDALDHLMLIRGEVDEAIDAVQKGYKVSEIVIEGGKPEGVAVELADTIILICSTCAHYGIPLQEALEMKLAYNKTRPYRHGKVS